jgi:hypothetical protein
MPLLEYNLHLAAFLNGFEPIGVAQTSSIAKLNTAAGRLVVVEHGYTGPEFSQGYKPTVRIQQKNYNF